MRRLLLLLALVPFVACSSDDEFTPTTPPGPSIPSIGGTYSSQTMWRFDRTLAGEQTQFICAGGLTIQTQIGTNFSGTFFLSDANCSSQLITGTVGSGTIQADGAVSFELALTGADPPFMSAVFGCTFVSGDRVLTGTLVGNQLDAQATTVMDCGANGQGTVVLRLSGTR